MAELGFLGVVVYTRVHTPRRCGQESKAADLLFLVIVDLPLRTNCDIVGIYFIVKITTPLFKGRANVAIIRHNSNACLEKICAISSRTEATIQSDRHPICRAETKVFYYTLIYIAHELFTFCLKNQSETMFIPGCKLRKILGCDRAFFIHLQLMYAYPILF